MMSEANDLRDFQTTGALRDGTPMTIRIARADDHARLEAAFAKLDSQTIYTRFFGFRKEIGKDVFAHLDAGDFDRFVGLLATLGSGPDEVVIGAVSYAVLDATPAGRAAEIAFVVEEDYQGQGLAGKLLTTAIEVARDHGISRFVADVLAANPAMLKVFRRSGLPMTTSREDGVIHFELDLKAGAAAQ